MNDNERILLMTCAAVLIGRMPVPLSPEDKAYLAPLVGGNDWEAVQANMLALIKSVAETRSG